jgi:predicted RNA-binding protein associated with RNAse of E/G family
VNPQNHIPHTVRVEFTRPGKGTSSFEELLIVDEVECKVLLLERHDQHATANGETILEPASPIIWFVFPGAWYEVGRFHTPAHIFTGWYTNICTPFEMHGAEWRTTDLFLDLWQPLGGVARFLDEEDLAKAMHIGLVDQRTERMIERTRAELWEAVRRGTWPPEVTREIDLPYVTARRSGAG